ncbi:short subunit dehydrogenase [Streptomyces sp. 3212.3]|nr:short subunit dehydrogenase [Streptomyces sp. 3212.3]
MGKLDGRVVIVTGAARGQGEQEARLFTEEGARVVLADVLDDRGEELAKELGQSYVHLDVARETDWAAAVAAAKDARGRIDGLVNNAGILRFNALVDTPLDEFMNVVQVNQVGCFLGIRAVAPEIAAAGGGTVVNTASYTAVTGMAAVGTYAATKHAPPRSHPGRSDRAGATADPRQRDVSGRDRHPDVQSRPARSRGGRKGDVRGARRALPQARAARPDRQAGGGRAARPLSDL